MKKITKSLMTLALLTLGVTSANAEERVIAEIDYSTVADQEISKDDPAGSTVSIANGLFTIVNTDTSGDAWGLQPAILEGFNVKQGYSYKITVKYKSTKAGNINFTWGDWNGHTAASYGVAIAANDDFADFVQTYNNVNFSISDNSAHVLWQCKGIEGTMYIKKVTVLEIVPDIPTTPQASTIQDGWEANVLGALTTHKAKDYIIETDGNGDTVAIHKDVIGDPVIESGVIKVTCDETRTPEIDPATGEQAKEWWGGPKWNEAAWDAQFWIVLPEQYPVGTKLHVTFDYKAKVAGTASTQTHALPGDYIGGGFSSNINFTTDWQTFEGDLEVPSHDSKKFQSIAFNLNEDIDPNVYYFKDISVQLPHMVSSITVGVTEAGWATVSHSEPFEVGEGIGFAAKYNGTSIELVPVTQVPANEGIIIKGTENHVETFSFGIIKSAELLDNDLQISDGTITGASGKIYVLAKGTQGVGFYKLATSATVPAGKAYLEVPGSSREFIGFAGEATAIKTVENQKKSGIIYNLAGQQVKNAKKGLYIIDGKKVIK